MDEIALAGLDHTKLTSGDQTLLHLVIGHLHLLVVRRNSDMERKPVHIFGMIANGGGCKLLRWCL
jgi:hypothetical protein